MNVQEVHQKIKEYESFVENKLKSDLKNVEIILRDKAEKFKDWEEVKHKTKIIRTFREKDRDMMLKVDIGNGIMAQGEITDFQQSYVHIGLGYLLEMDCDEADRYADIRMKLLKKEITHFRKVAVDIKVHIKLTLLAMSELQATVVPSIS